MLTAKYLEAIYTVAHPVCRTPSSFRCLSFTINTYSLGNYGANGGGTCELLTHLCNLLTDTRTRFRFYHAIYPHVEILWLSYINNRSLLYVTVVRGTAKSNFFSSSFCILILLERRTKSFSKIILFSFPSTTLIIMLMPTIRPHFPLFLLLQTR